MADLYAIRRGGSWDYDGKPADRGLVFPLAGAVNDEKLVRLGFIEKVERPRKLEQYPRCGHCGNYFLDDRFLVAHGDLRHNARRENALVVGAGHPLEGLGGYSATGLPEGAILPDLTGDSAEARLERETPIYWEKTAASQKG